MAYTKPNYDAEKTSRYNHWYYELNKYDKWGYKGIRSRKFSPFKKSATRSSLTNTVSSITSPKSRTPTKIQPSPNAAKKREARKSLNSSGQSQLSQLKKDARKKQTEAEKKAKSTAQKKADNLQQRINLMTESELKANKKKLRAEADAIKKEYNDALEAAKNAYDSDAQKYLDKVSRNSAYKTKTEEATNKKNEKTEEKKPREKVGLTEKATKEETKKSSKTTTSKGTSGSSRSKSSDSSKSNKTSDKSKTDEKTKEATSMDEVSLDGLNAKQKAQAKKKRQELEEKKAEELAKLSEEYKESVNRLINQHMESIGDNSPTTGQDSLYAKINALSEANKARIALIESDYLEQYQSYVKRLKRGKTSKKKNDKQTGVKDVKGATKTKTGGNQNGSKK